MIKLTEFTSVVDTYKKNFDIRSKRFSDKKKKDQAANKEQREARIESKKFFSSVGAKVAEKIKPGGNILDTVIRFAGFTLLGVLVKNLDKVAAFAKQVIEKVKEFAIRFKKYFDDVLVPLFNDIVGLGTQIKDTFGDIANFVIRMNPYNELSDVLGTVMSGILALGYRIASLYRPFTTPTTPGATPPATKAPVKTPAQSSVKPVASKQKLLEKARERQVSGAEAKTAVRRAFVRSRRLAEKMVREPAKELVTAGSSSATKPPSPAAGTTFGQRITADTPGLFNTNISQIKAKSAIVPYNPLFAAENLKFESTKKILEYIENQRKLGIEPDPQLIEEASNRAKEKAKLIPRTKLEGKVKTINQSQIAKARLRGDLLRQGVSMTTGFDDLLRSIETTKPSRFSLENITGTIKSGLKKLTTGLDFRFDAGKVLKEQLLSPKNFLKNLGSFGIGVGLDVGAKLLGKYISSILPYNEDFELLGYLGMIDPDRIHQLTAGKIINLPDDKRRKAIKRLEKDSKSSDDIFGTGQKKREMANAILKYISIFSGGEFGSLEKSKVPAIDVPKSDQQIKPGMLTPGEYTPEELKQLEEIQKRFKSQSSVSKPSMVASVNRNISDGLDGPTTYGSQGMIKSREMIVAILPVEKVVSAPA